MLGFLLQLLQRGGLKQGDVLLSLECLLLASYFLDGFIELLPEGSDGLGLLAGPFADLDLELLLFLTLELIDFLNEINCLLRSFSLQGLSAVL